MFTRSHYCLPMDLLTEGDVCCTSREGPLNGQFSDIHIIYCLPLQSLTDRLYYLIRLIVHGVHLAILKIDTICFKFEPFMCIP